jgi:hypothetical protein
MPKFESLYILVNEDYVPSLKVRFPFETLFASDPVRVFLPEDNDIKFTLASAKRILGDSNGAIKILNELELKTNEDK